MFSVEYSERAIRELEEIVYWYNVRSAKALNDFINEFNRRLEIIKTNPI